MAAMRTFRAPRLLRDWHWLDSLTSPPESGSSSSSLSLSLASGRFPQCSHEANKSKNGGTSLPLEQVCGGYAPLLRSVHSYERALGAYGPAALRRSSTGAPGQAAEVPRHDEGGAEETTKSEGRTKEEAKSAPKGEEEEEEDEKTKILRAAMAHVTRLGWMESALVAGAKDVGLSPAIVGAFPRKDAALVEYFMDDCNNRLADELEAREKELSAMLLADCVSSIVHFRLEMQAPYVSKWAQALSIQLNHSTGAAVVMANPLNISTSLKQRAVLMDDIWHAAGDQSTDMDWYTKRTLLGGIYTATELYMLTDFSPDWNLSWPGFRDTWTFLGRRIKDAIDCRKTAQEASQLAQALSTGLGNSINSFFNRRSSSPKV